MLELKELVPKLEELVLELEKPVPRLEEPVLGLEEPVLGLEEPVPRLEELGPRLLEDKEDHHLVVAQHLEPSKECEAKPKLEPKLLRTNLSLSCYKA